MASLKDATAVTSQVTELTDQLNEQLSEGDGDFSQLAELADSISERADQLAAGFAAMNEALQQRLPGSEEEEER
jgi:ABC-type transporter Mla subunit MlaD